MNPFNTLNKELDKYFRTLTSEKHVGHVEYINVKQTNINETYHKTTSFTSIELHMGSEKWKTCVENLDSYN